MAENPNLPVSDDDVELPQDPAAFIAEVSKWTNEAVKREAVQAWVDAYIRNRPDATPENIKDTIDDLMGRVSPQRTQAAAGPPRQPWQNLRERIDQGGWKSGFSGEDMMSVLRNPHATLGEKGTAVAGAAAYLPYLAGKALTPPIARGRVGDGVLGAIGSVFPQGFDITAAAGGDIGHAVTGGPVGELTGTILGGLGPAGWMALASRFPNVLGRLLKGQMSMPTLGPAARGVAERAKGLHEKLATGVPESRPSSGAPIPRPAAPSGGPVPGAPAPAAPPAGAAVPSPIAGGAGDFAPPAGPKTKLRFGPDGLKAVE